MLRLRRAEAPVKWRSEHNLLAAANADWASQAVGGTGITWASPDWVDYTREETYHLLCSDPHGNLPTALASAVLAAEHSAIRARQWAGLIADAGRDTSNGHLREWGHLLAQGIQGGDLSAYFSCLINDARLDQSILVIALEQRGEIYRILRRYDDALADLNSVIEADPGRAWAIGSRGETYRLMGHYDEALADFNRAIELDPGYAWAIGSRGQTYKDMGRYDQAQAQFSSAIELRPDYAWAFGSRGEIHRDMGHYAEALADFNHAIELRPDYTWAFGGRGETYRLMGRYDDALADLHSAIEQNPGNSWALGHRGQTYQAMGRNSEALADLKRAIEIDPNLDWAIASRDQIRDATSGRNVSDDDLTG